MLLAALLGCCVKGRRPGQVSRWRGIETYVVAINAGFDVAILTLSARVAPSQVGDNVKLVLGRVVIVDKLAVVLCAGPAQEMIVAKLFLGLGSLLDLVHGGLRVRHLRVVAVLALGLPAVDVGREDKDL